MTPAKTGISLSFCSMPCLTIVCFFYILYQSFSRKALPLEKRSGSISYHSCSGFPDFFFLRFFLWPLFGTRVQNFRPWLTVFFANIWEDHGARRGSRLWYLWIVSWQVQIPIPAFSHIFVAENCGISKVHFPGKGCPISCKLAPSIFRLGFGNDSGRFRLG